MHPLEVYKKYCYENNRLASIQVNIIGKCNANCPFCFQDGGHEGKLNYDEVMDVIQQARELGVYGVAFSGGEPLLHPDFIKIVKQTRKMGMEVTFITNGHFLNPAIIDELQKIYIKNIGVSFHASSSSQYSEIFKVDERYFYHVLKMIEYINELNLSVSIACTVFKENINNLFEIRSLIDNINPNISISYNVAISGVRMELEDEIDSETSLEKVPFDKRQNHRYSRLCTVAKSSIVVNYNGDIQACSFFPGVLGNIKKNRIIDIWNHSEELRYLRTIDKNTFTECTGCPKEDYCGICLARNYNVNKDYTKIPKDYCEAMLNFSDARRIL